MNRLIILNLFICVGCITSATILLNKEKIEAYKDLIKCTREFCEEQNLALRALFKDELDTCLKKCNAGDKKLNTLNENERKKLRECFKENNCKLPMEHIKKNRNTPQFKALRQCAEAKCQEQFSKIRQIDNSFD